MRTVAHYAWVIGRIWFPASVVTTAFAARLCSLTRIPGYDPEADPANYPQPTRHR